MSETLHTVEFSFPKPNDLIHNAPNPNTVDTLLDEQAEKAGLGWLDTFFEGVTENIYTSDIFKTDAFSKNMDWAFNDNRKDFIIWNEYQISFILTQKDFLGNEIWNVNFTILFGKDDITLTYSSKLVWYKEVTENSITVYSLSDIITVVNSELLPIPEEEI